MNQHKLCFQGTNNGNPILGKTACVALNLLSRVDKLHDVQVWKTQEFAPKKHLVNKHIFDGISTIKVDTTIHVDPHVTPDPLRRIPHATESEVKKELDRMVKIGVIARHIEPTPWVNSITIVKKPQ